MNLLKITPLTFKHDVQIAIPATLLIMHIYFPMPLAKTELPVSVVRFSLSCVIKARGVGKSWFENSHVILSGQLPFTTEQLTIPKSPELMSSVPNV
jgi:hypothetical protein